MKHRRTIVIVLLNVLFCALLLYLFVNNSYLRPYAGNAAKEVLAGLLLATLYANYFLLYPLLHKKHPTVYWAVVVFVSIVAGLIEMAIAWPFMKRCNAAVVHLGSFMVFFHHMIIVTAPTLVFNFFPFMFRERQELQKALDVEVQVVYSDTQMVDVIDHDRNLLMISKDDIYYCVQDGNFTRIHTGHDNWSTRLDETYCATVWGRRLCPHFAHRFSSVSVHLVVQRQRGVPEKDAVDEEAAHVHVGSQKQRYDRRPDCRRASAM